MKQFKKICTEPDKIYHHQVLNSLTEPE